MNTEDILFNMVILGISRFLDLLSTWYCTPNFKMGVNPWMKTASWKTVILVNIILVIILPVVLQKRTIFLAVLFTL